MVSAQLHVHIPICSLFCYMCLQPDLQNLLHLLPFSESTATCGTRYTLSAGRLCFRHSSSSLQLPTLNLPIHSDLDPAIFHSSCPIISETHRVEQTHQQGVPGAVVGGSGFKAVEKVHRRRLPGAQRIICRICNLLVKAVAVAMSVKVR